MLRRILWSEEIYGEPILRINFFKTKCKIDGKYCNVIIYSGSLDNLESKKLVNKL